VSRLTPLLAPNSIAVIGASPDETKMGTRCLAQIVRHGFPGVLHPVHRSAERILDIPTVPDLAAIPTPPDLVIVSVPAAAVPGVIADCGAAGIRAAMVLSSGFSETGPEGAALQEELRRVASEHDVVVLGPNSNGFAAMGLPLIATSNPALNTTPRAGGLGVVSQTGGLGLGSLQHMANARLIGLSHNISTGNEAVLGTSDFIEHLVLDPGTDAIAVVSEGIRDGAAFLRAARRAREAGKPVAMLKLGRTERGGRMTRSHTGMLAGDFDVQSQVLREAGVLVVRDIDELLDSVRLASSIRSAGIPAGRRAVGILSPSGGAAVLASDVCTEVGVEVAEVGPETSTRLREILPAYAAAANPVDLTATGTYHVGMHVATIWALAADPSVGAVLCILTVSADFDRMLEGIVAGIADVEVPIVFAGLGGAQTGRGFATLEEAGYLVFGSLTAAAQALSRTLGPGAGGYRAARLPVDRPSIAERTGAEVVRGWAPGPRTEHETKQLLRTYGVPCVEEELVTDDEEVVAAARRIGFPVVLKAVVDGLVHKTEVGGVELDLPDEAALRAAVARMRGRLAAHGGGLRLLVQPMLTGGTELIVGVSTDPQFGKVVLVGAGGTLTELLRDRVLRSAPVTEEEAEAMVRELASFALLDGFRGRPKADVRALARVVARVSDLATEWDEQLEELDLNPVLVDERGAVALDAVAVWR